MKVLGICSSPRSGGNSQSLVEHILSGAENAGADTEIIRLCAMDIKPCTGCNICNTGIDCNIQDDMPSLIDKMKDADAVVFGSPVYWFRLNAQAYPFIDRFYSLLKLDFSTDFPKGKKFVVALTCGGAGPDVLDPINDYLKNVFSFLGFNDAGFIWQNNCMMPKDLKDYPEKIKQAEQLGRELVK